MGLNGLEKIANWRTKVAECIKESDKTEDALHAYAAIPVKKVPLCSVLACYGAGQLCPYTKGFVRLFWKKEGKLKSEINWRCLYPKIQHE